MSEIIIVELKNLSRDLQERGLLVSSETVDKAVERLAEAEAQRDEACRCLQEALRYVPSGLRRERYEIAAKGGRDE